MSLRTLSLLRRARRAAGLFRQQAQFLGQPALAGFELRGVASRMPLHLALRTYIRQEYWNSPQWSIMAAAARRHGIPVGFPEQDVTVGDVLLFGVHYEVDRFVCGREPKGPRYRVADYTTDPAAATGDNIEFVEALGRHPKYRSSLGPPEDFADAPGANQYFRRKSKAALHWALFSTNKTIHFVLDGIDMGAVVRKDAQTRHTSDTPCGKCPRGYPLELKERLITHAELRWLFRHRFHPEVQDRVCFWYCGEPCDPPWEVPGWRPLWTHYRPEHAPGLDN
jgi:hypothetical protein